MKKIISILIVVVLIGSLGYGIFIFRNNYQASRISILEKENNNLRNILAARGSSPISAEENGFAGLNADVFSSYPFNNRNLMVISAGRRHGVRAGMPVTARGDMLIGQIQSVYNRYSIMKTIFDPEWSSPVYIGNGRINGLLVGGLKPRLKLINKEADINIGDQVRSAGEKFPFGLNFGTIAALISDPARSFQEATLAPGVALNTLRKVFIITDFSPE